MHVYMKYQYRLPLIIKINDLLYDSHYAAKREHVGLFNMCFAAVHLGAIIHFQF